MKQFVDDNPIQRGYSEIFDEEVVVDFRFEAEQLKEQFLQRTEQKLPPGYKDRGKARNASGDFEIWKTLLCHARGSQRDLVFVSDDMKADWWHRDSGSAFAPRYELVEEYRRASDGGMFHIVSIKELLDELDMPELVVDEIETSGEALEGEGNALLVHDNQAVLVRGADGYAAFVLLDQKPEGLGQESTGYVSWYSQSLGDFYDMRSVTPFSGQASSGSGQDQNILAGPYSIPWSVASRGSGWIYHWRPEESPVGPEYQLAVLSNGDFGFRDFTTAHFNR